MRVAVLLGLAVPLLLNASGAARAAEEAPLAYEEKLLREAGVKTDGPGLVTFFRTRRLAPGDQERLVRAVRLLGDNAFRVREQATTELLAAGRCALPYLRPALQNADPEVVRR